MSSTSSRPADQPNQRRAARKVSRASSGPGSTRRWTPVSARTRASTWVTLVASRTAEVAKASSSSAASRAVARFASVTAATSASSPALVSSPAGPICSASRRNDFSEWAGHGWAPW